MPLNNGGQIRFMVDNLIHAGVKEISASSEHNDFPLTNLTGANKNFRGRPFRFKGRFEITSANNKLYFSDAGGAHTATITVGEYASRDLMAAAIQTAMNAVSSGYIVTWNSTVRKFVINGTARVLTISNNNSAIWETIGFISGTDTSSGTAHTATEPRLHYPYEFIKIDFGYYPDIGFFALIADSASALKISPMASVILEANTIDDFSSPAVSIALTRTNRGIFEFLDDDDYNYRFWRLRIEDNFAEDEAEVGYLYLGEFACLRQHYNDQGATASLEDRSKISESESGQTYTINKPSRRTYENISLQYIAIDEVNKLRDLFDRAGVGNPFFISIDPKLEITETLDDATFFCRLDESPRFTHIVSNKYSTSFKVKEWL